MGVSLRNSLFIFFKNTWRSLQISCEKQKIYQQFNEINETENELTILINEDTIRLIVHTQNYQNYEKIKKLKYTLLITYDNS